MTTTEKIHWKIQRVWMPNFLPKTNPRQFDKPLDSITKSPNLALFIAHINENHLLILLLETSKKFRRTNWSQCQLKTSCIVSRSRNVIHEPLISLRFFVLWPKIFVAYPMPKSSLSKNSGGTFTPLLCALGGVMFSQLENQTFTSEFEYYWVPHSFNFVPHRTKKIFVNNYLIRCWGR